jgi:hypothetical protein
MRSIAPRYLVAAAAFIVALSCGEVPTFPGGIAFIGPVLLPSPAVAALDTLRDSVGKVAPLRVVAFDINNNVIPNVPVTFVVSSVPPGVKIDSNGIVTAFDSLQQVQIVGRVGARLQTTPVNLFVVTQPDLIEQSAAVDSLVIKSSALSVKVSGLRRGTRIPVQAIIVHYQILKVNNSTNVDSTVFTLVDDGGNPVKGDPRTAVDTTDAAGIASRVLISATTAGVDSVVVTASATNLKGALLGGSPVRFVIPVKKGR